jgi:putative viral A-type inclusion protein
MMSSKIVAISVDKIQKYIYQRIDDMTSQELNDSNTLSSILWASKEVKKGILKEIENGFKEENIEIEEYILKISGKYIFKVNIEENQEVKIKECLKTIFKKVYKKYQGQLFLKYKYFNKNKIEDKEDKIEYIEKSTEYLKLPEIKGEIIEENSDIIFNFMELEEKNINEKIKNIENNSEKKNEMFVKKLDDLAPINRNNKKEINNEIKNRGKIAIVKADINNMGSIFRKINSYNKYQKLSEILEDTLNMENFSEKIKDFNLENKILPFYIEGDDIFFATKIGSLLKSVELLKSWINELRGKIENEKIGKEINITISVGATFVDNHQPIRYYRKVVEQELAKAKYKMKTEKADKAILGISISDVSLFCYDGEKGKGENDGFNAFEKSIKELNLIKGNIEKSIIEMDLFKKDRFFSNSYFYNLLQNIEHEKDKKRQIRILLYRLLPNIVDEKERQKDENKKDKKILMEINQNEIYLKYYLIKHVIKNKKDEKTIEKDKEVLSYEKINNNLIPKLRLFILLTDIRYIKNLDIEDILKVKQEIKKFFNDTKNKKNKNIKKIKTKLFNSPIDYLYSEITQKEILKLFVKKIEQNKDIKSRYKKVPFQLSFFYKIKSIIEMKENNDIKIKFVIRLFENMCEIINKNILEVTDKNNEIKNKKDEKKEQINYRLDFKLDKFKELIKNEIESTEWLDILILFYSYTQQKVKYTNIYGIKKNKNREKQNQK